MIHKKGNVKGKKRACWGKSVCERRNGMIHKKRQGEKGNRNMKKETCTSGKI